MCGTYKLKEGSIAKKERVRYHYFLRTSHFSFDEVQRGREGAREDVWIRASRGQKKSDGTAATSKNRHK